MNLPTAYPFKTKPYAHQLEAWDRSKEAEDYALFMEMGTGKSKVIVDTMAYLFDRGRINKVLVLANKGSYLNWISSELPTHMPSHVRYFASYWSSGVTKELEEQHKKLLAFDPTVLKVFVVNIEALAHDRGREAVLRFVSSGECLSVVDESTTIKNPDAKRTKVALKVGALSAYRRIMTGSPVTQGPLDLFSQCEFLRPGRLGFGSFYTFRNYFATLINMQAGQRSFKKVAGYRNLDELQKILEGFSFRVTKEECLDLPPKVYQVREVELTKEQRDVYEKLKQQAFAELEGQLVTAPLVITKLLRLHQVVCGHVTDDDGVTHELKSNRLGALQEVIEEASGSVIIWANYRRDVEAVSKLLADEYGPESVVTYYGDTAAADRPVAVARVQSGEARFFVGNQRTGGYGVTLTRPNTVVYYSNNYDLELRLQSEDRAHRIGQTQRVTYVDLVARKTVDEQILKCLRQKRQLAAEVLGDSWRELF